MIPGAPNCCAGVQFPSVFKRFEELFVRSVVLATEFIGSTSAGGIIQAEQSFCFASIGHGNCQGTETFQRICRGEQDRGCAKEEGLHQINTNPTQGAKYGYEQTKQSSTQGS
jgi:hypothetical protein